jgi:hypothetical protein
MIDFSKYFAYDETSPSCLRWIVDRFSGRNMSIKHISKGDVAGSIARNSKRAVYRVQLNGKNYLVHRVIWWLFNKNFKEKYVIDHINGDPLCNFIINLREVTHQTNSVNSKKSTKNTSGWVGVDFHTKENGKFTYAVACLKDQDGKSIQKTFSVKRHGIMVATRLAILKRREIVKSLEEFGIYYSERHGK